MLLAETLDLRDAGTGQHSRIVGDFAGRSPRRSVSARTTSPRIHAAGRPARPRQARTRRRNPVKPGPLNDAEWAEIRQHPEIGARILERAGMLDIAAWVRAHHERSTARLPARIGGRRDPDRGADPRRRRRVRGDDRRAPYRARCAGERMRRATPLRRHPVRPGRHQRVPVGPPTPRRTRARAHARATQHRGVARPNQGPPTASRANLAVTLVTQHGPGHQLSAPAHRMQLRTMSSTATATSHQRSSPSGCARGVVVGPGSKEGDGSPRPCRSEGMPGASRGKVPVIVRVGMAGCGCRAMRSQGRADGRWCIAGGSLSRLAVAVDDVQEHWHDAWIKLVASACLQFGSCDCVG